MKFLGFVGALMFATPTLAQAETLMFEYFSGLGPADAYNSRGQPLDDFCGIVQQDRANWHKFGKRENLDSPDPFFDSPQRRAMITGNCQFDRGYFANPGVRIRSGTRQFYVYVRVFGSGGQVTRVLISEGAG